jgi:putative chitinase
MFDTTQVQLPVGLKLSAQAGARFLLSKIAADAAITAAPCGMAWAAYMMATVEHETARTFIPIEEIGRGEGKPYGVVLQVACACEMTGNNRAMRLGKAAQNSLRQNVYYGRGYVQLTWQSNYSRLGQALGMGRLLMEQPEVALQPEIAYAILSYGMTRGVFTGKRLGNYLNTSGEDFVQARRIVNGLDFADEIAALAVVWETNLLAASNQTAITAASAA